MSTEGKWILGNPFFERVIHFEAQVGLYTHTWLHKLSGTDYLERARSAQKQRGEYALAVNGQGITSLSPTCALVQAETQAASSGELLSITLYESAFALSVTVNYFVYYEHPAVRKWLTITNAGVSPVIITRLSMETLELACGEPTELQLFAFYGTVPREMFFTGRTEDVLLVQKNARTGEGFAVLNEAPAHLKRVDTPGSWTGGVDVGYNSDLFPFERQIAPQETFISAGVSMLFIQDDGQLERRQLIPTYASEVLFKKGTAYRPQWFYNTWEGFFRNIDEDTVQELIPIAARMGIDVFTIDDGWQAEYGENHVSPERFPHGLENIQAEVEKQGMRLGLWVPLAVVSNQTQVYREHPEWLCHDANHHPKLTGTAAGMQPVMCLATPYREDVARRLVELVSLYHLSYIKVDLTTVFNAYGESPGCFASGHQHGSWAESLTRIYEAIRWIMDEVYALHPDLLIDLSYELWGQKHIIDYGLLAAGDLDWLSNVQDKADGSAGPLHARTLLYQRALAIPAEAMLIGNLEANRQPIEERFATAIGSTPLLLGDLRELSDGQQEWYRQKIAWFKQVRQAVPIQQSFFPLGGWQQPAITNWDGFARLSRKGEGIIVIFKNACPSETATISLPVPGQAGYRLYSVMEQQPPRSFSAEQVRSGISLPLNEGVNIYELRCSG
jgi:alpha-galactosidase